MSTLQEKAEHLMLGCNAMGWHSSAILVNDLLQQRAELLEALKKVKEWNDRLGMLSTHIAEYMDSAITKAEAAE